VDPKEWNPGEAAGVVAAAYQPVPLAWRATRAKAKLASHAWLECDDAHLYVAFANRVDPAKGVTGGHMWGKDDAVEIALSVVQGKKLGDIIVLRGYTDVPAVDGWYYCCSKAERGPAGKAFFRFKPEGPNGPEVESLGVNWAEGEDVLQMPVSPGGRYVYFNPRAYPGPLVQYDVLTRKKKVICWLQDYYFEKYGYWFSSNYGMEISTDGSFIAICMNGTFEGRDKTYGHPSLIVIEIPEEERREVPAEASGGK